MEEVPEKIYVSIHSGIHHYEQKNDDDIEYVRTDVFIKKVEEYLKNNFVNDAELLVRSLPGVHFREDNHNWITIREDTLVQAISNGSTYYENEYGEIVSNKLKLLYGCN